MSVQAKGDPNLKPLPAWRGRLQSPQWKPFLFVFCNVFVLNAILLFVPKVDPATSPDKIRPSTFLVTIAVFRGVQLQDSLGTMLPALHLLERDRSAPVYEKIFFEQHTKFQYPLTSLLPYYWLQRAGASDHTLYRLSKYCVDLSLCLTILLSALMGVKLCRENQPGGFARLDAGLAALAIAMAGLFFCPMTIAAYLGQIQTPLTLGITAALYLWLLKREWAAGAVIGLAALVKPQYALFLVWALVRRKYGAFAAGLSAIAAGMLVSCVTFGLHNNLEYVAVLQYIGRRGESFLANQSFNALLNHVVGNGSLMSFDPKSFAPHNPIVFLGTMVSSLVLVMVGIFWPWGKERSGGAVDLACILLIATMASQIAWNHHYGILLPIFVLLWFGGYAWKRSAWATALVAISYAGVSNVFAPPAFVLESTAWKALLATYLFYGAILALILLLNLKQGKARDAVRPVAMDLSHASPETAP